MVIEQIIADIEYLKTNTGNLDVSAGLEIQQRLASNSMYLATKVAEAFEEKNTAEFVYKSNLNAYIVNYKGEKLSEKKLEAKAKEAYRDQYKNLVEAENLWNRLTLILRQTNINIETLRQTVSQLKVEFNMQNHGIN